MEYIIFNGQKSSDFGITISGEGVYNAPARKYDSYVVPGRNGALLIDTGMFENITVSYPAAITRDLKTYEAAIRNWLLGASGYCELRDTYHPDEFRIARYSGGFTFNEITQLHRDGRMTLSFDCKPQRFLDAGKQAINVPYTGVDVVNPALNLSAFCNASAKPIFMFFFRSIEAQGVTIRNASGNTTGTISVVGEAAEFGTVTIDCETLDARFPDGSNANIYVSVSGAPELPLSGVSHVSAVGLNPVTMIPRWWAI